MTTIRLLALVAAATVLAACEPNDVDPPAQEARDPLLDDNVNDPRYGANS